MRIYGNRVVEYSIKEILLNTTQNNDLFMKNSLETKSDTINTHIKRQNLADNRKDVIKIVLNIFDNCL